MAERNATARQDTCISTARAHICANCAQVSAGLALVLCAPRCGAIQCDSEVASGIHAVRFRRFVALAVLPLAPCLRAAFVAPLTRAGLSRIQVGPFAHCAPMSALPRERESDWQCDSSCHGRRCRCRGTRCCTRPLPQSRLLPCVSDNSPVCSSELTMAAEQPTANVKLVGLARARFVGYPHPACMTVSAFTTTYAREVGLNAITLEFYEVTEARAAALSARAAPNDVSVLEGLEPLLPNKRLDTGTWLLAVGDERALAGEHLDRGTIVA
jgi:hypothetical protein